MITYFILFFSLFFFWLSWNYQKYSLFLILALLPAYQIRWQLFGIPLTFLEILILISFLVWLIKKIKIKEKIFSLAIKKNRSTLALFFFWVLVSGGAIFLSPVGRAGAGFWKAYFLEPFLFLIVFLDVLKKKKDFLWAGAALVSSGIIVCFYSLCQKIVGQGVWSTEVWGQSQILRVTGFFSHPNFLGLYLAPLFILGLGLIFFQFRKEKIKLVLSTFLLLILCGLSFIFARAEGAIVAIILILFLGGLIYAPARKWTLVLFLIFVLLISFYPSFRSGIAEKVFLRDLSGRLRINIWQGAWQIIKDGPILGQGLGGYQVLAPQYQKPYYGPDGSGLVSVETHPYPHNLFLALWLELGLLGLVIFFLILFRFFEIGFRKIREEPILVGSLMGAMLVILIYGLVDTPYFKNDLAILFWVIIGLMMGIKNLKNKKAIFSPN
ncbi:O-antigen ligase family protein [Patescibacteria group bacterium]|nr:O-antigen ligase family protein [Patescibacteria group bacterium]